MDEDKTKTPQHFGKLKSERYYGTLKLDRNKWIIEAEPHLTQMIKRLFPITEIHAGGRAEFPINKRQIGDLNWFMMRYPLEILDMKEWKSQMREAIKYYKTREKIKSEFIKENPAISFKGQLFDFQKEGLAYILGNQRCLLADEMGLGKTVQGLAMISKTNFPVLIVTPPHLLYQWRREIKRFLGNDVTVQILKGIVDYKQTTLMDADIYLIHYLILRGWKKRLSTMNFETIIFDEIQELRRNQSQKYSAAEKITKNTKNIIGLSGTPIYNYGAEMWNVMNIIEPFALGEWEFFTREWCGGWGHMVVQDPKKLGSYLYENGSHYLKQIIEFKKSPQFIN